VDFGASERARRGRPTNTIPAPHRYSETKRATLVKLVGYCIERMLRLVLLLPLLVLLGQPAHALDVEVVKTTCDKSLPVTADLYLKCETGSRCTFGNTSLVGGTGAFV
jgi:hypothetical protein